MANVSEHHAGSHGEPVIVCRQVVRSYPMGGATVQAVRGIDLSIARGEFAAITGPSGCGKTTMGNALAMIANPPLYVVAGTMEIDGEVIRLCQEHMPMIAGDAWTNPRGQVIVGDGIDYVRRAPDGGFDVIIVDSTDPIGVGEVLFTDEFYENAARILGPAGIIVNQCGVPFMQADELRDTSARRAKFFAEVSAYVAAVPTYVGGFMTLGWSAKAAGLRDVPVAMIRERAEAAGILGQTRYWSPEMHASCFNLPPYIAENLRPA